MGTILETNGTRLTKVNTDRINSEHDAEIILASIVHEAAHTGHGGSYGQGVASHPPDFWVEFARIATILLTNDTAWTAVQTMFERDLDRHRFKYRLLQNLSTNQVDNRQQTDEECKCTFAENIGFDTYGLFDDVYAVFGHDDARFPNNPYAIKLEGVAQTYRPAVGFSDEELLNFAQSVGTETDYGALLVPAPLVTLPDGDDALRAPDSGAPKPDIWRRAAIEDVRYLSSQDHDTLLKTLALQDRLQNEVWVTDARIIDDGEHPATGYGLELPEFTSDSINRWGDSLQRFLSFNTR